MELVVGIEYINVVSPRHYVSAFGEGEESRGAGKCTNPPVAFSGQFSSSMSSTKNEVEAKIHM